MDVFKKWLKAATIRAVKAAAEAAIGVIGASSVVMSDVMWPMVASAAMFGAVMSYLMSVKGIPEVADGASVVKIVKEDEND